MLGGLSYGLHILLMLKECVHLKVLVISFDNFAVVLLFYIILWSMAAVIAECMTCPPAEHSAGGFRKTLITSIGYFSLAEGLNLFEVFRSFLSKDYPNSIPEIEANKSCDS